jgi:uncharacterized membrane protein YdjX (TVP38/TMEM64 family)
LNKRREWTIKIVILAAAIAIVVIVPQVRIFLKRIILVFSMMDINAIKGYILSYGLWAPAISFLLMVLKALALPIPSFMITFANAALFGWWKGAILSWTSSMAGAALCFYLARFYGRELVEKLVGRLVLESADNFFKRYGRYAVLVCRLLPFISFTAVSYASGLTSMGFWGFFLATGIGQLPATLVYSYVGAMLFGTVKTFVTAILLLMALFVLLLWLKRYFQERKAGSVDG